MLYEKWQVTWLLLYHNAPKWMIAQTLKTKKICGRRSLLKNLAQKAKIRGHYGQPEMEVEWKP